MSSSTVGTHLLLSTSSIYIFIYIFYPHTIAISTSLDIDRPLHRLSTISTPEYLQLYTDCRQLYSMSSTTGKIDHPHLTRFAQNNAGRTLKAALAMAAVYLVTRLVCLLLAQTNGWMWLIWGLECVFLGISFSIPLPARISPSFDIILIQHS